MTPPKAAPWGRRAAVLVKAVVSLGIIVFLISRLDVGQLLTRTAGINKSLAMATGILCLLQFLVATYRWMAVADSLGQHLPLARSFRITYIGQFFNLALPSSVGGDAVRIWILWKGGMGAMIAVGTVLLDRLAAVLGLVLVVALAYPLMPPVPEAVSLRIAVFGVLGLSVGGLVVALGFERLSRSWAPLAKIAVLAKVSRGFKALFLSPRHAVTAVGCGMLGQINLSISLYLLALALEIDISLAHCLVLWPLVVLVTLAPISIAGWGVREGAMVAILALAGIPGESALLLSLLSGIISTVVSLPGGLVWLASMERSIVTEIPSTGESPFA